MTPDANLDPKVAALVSAAFDKSWPFVKTDPELAHVDRQEAPAGRQSLVARSNRRLISGQNSRSSASVVMEPTRPFDQNTRRSPPAPIIAKRKASSARLPNTNASVNGASGMPIFLNT